MKAPKDKNKSNKHKNKKKTNFKPKKEKVLVVAQEFKFARLLSGNEKKTRDRVLKTLKKWLLNCFEKKYEFKEDDFIRVWKGLFYAVWMSDKPLVQEDLCESIAGILDLFPSDQLKSALLMVKAGFKVLAIEWYGIDHHRMDKFLMLVRRYLRGSFRCLLRCDWSLDACEKFAAMLSSGDGILAVKTPIYARNAMSLALHITDCYLEELSKVSKGQIPEASVAALLEPFTTQVCGGEVLALAVAARRVLTALLRQSQLGLQYQEATEAWKKMGCPTGGPEALELVSDDEDTQERSDGAEVQEEKDGPLDPRAGRVDVVLTPLAVPAGRLAGQLRAKLAAASSRAHKRARICLQRFEELSRDEYPLKIQAGEAAGLEPGLSDAEPARAAGRLRALERRLLKQSDELALRGLSRKHRKRLLAKSRAGVSLVDELGAPDTTDGNWQVEETKPKKQRKGDSNKENEGKGKSRKRKLQKNVRDDRSAEPRTSPSTSDAHDHGTKKKKPNNEKIKKDKPDKQAESNDACKDNILLNKVPVESNVIKSKKDKVPKQTEVQSNRQEKKDELKNKSKSSAKKTENLNDKDAKSKISNSVKKVESPKKVQSVIKKVESVNKVERVKKVESAKVLVNKVKNYQKIVKSNERSSDSPKKVKFVLKNNSMQAAQDYYRSVRQSPSIPFDGAARPRKANLKPSTPSPINPFFKRKIKLRNKTRRPGRTRPRYAAP